MDESTIGSIRRRVPMLDGEFYNSWKNEMLEIFNEYNLNKYISSPCVPPVDPLHPNPTTKKYTSVMIRVCHSRSHFLSCMYIHDDFMTESR